MTVQVKSLSYSSVDWLSEFISNLSLSHQDIPVAGTTLSGELVPMVPDNVSIGSGMGP